MQHFSKPNLASYAQRGFNLVELMVAMTIGLFLIGGVGYLFIGSKQSFNSMDALGMMQENARYAFEHMGKDIRMAGFNGISRSSSSVASVVTDTYPPSDAIKRVADLYNRVSPTPTNSAYGPLRGYEQSQVSFETPNANTDALVVVRADSDHAFTLSADPTTTSPVYAINCPAEGIPLPKQGELFVVADMTRSQLVQLGANTSTGSSCSGTWNVDVGSISGFTGGWASRVLYRLNGVMYFIENEDSGEPALKKLMLTTASNAPSTTEQPMLEGVKDMQIMYGEDTNNNGNVNGYYDATAVTDWSKVLSVRVTLTLTSLTNIKSDGGRLEKDFTTTIAVRNRL